MEADLGIDLIKSFQVRSEENDKPRRWNEEKVYIHASYRWEYELIF